MGNRTVEIRFDQIESIEGGFTKGMRRTYPATVKIYHEIETKAELDSYKEAGLLGIYTKEGKFSGAIKLTDLMEACNDQNIKRELLTEFGEFL